MRIAVCIVSILISQLVWGATKTASVTGDWNNSATWGGAAVPENNDDVVINNGVTVTMTANYTTSATLTLNGTATIQMAGYNATVGSLIAYESAVINNIEDATTLTVGSANTDFTYTGTITNAVNLVKTGSGTFTFSPTGDFTFRNIDVVEGTLNITSGNITLSDAIEYGNRLRANGGTLNLSGGSINAIGGYVVAGFGTNGTIHFTGCNVSADALMVGWNGNGIVNVSAGTLYLMYQIRHYDNGEGTLTINGGTVICGEVISTTGAGNSAETPFTINLNSGGTLLTSMIHITAEEDDDEDPYNEPPHKLILNLNGGTLTAAGPFDLFGLNTHGSGDATGKLYVNLLANSYINTNNHTVTLLVGIDDGLGTFGITKQGTGTLIYAVNNAYDGSTIISEGTLQVGTGGTIGTLGTGNIDISGGTLSYNRSDDINLSSVFSTITHNGHIENNGVGLLTVNSNDLKMSGTPSLYLGGSGIGIFSNSIASNGATGNLVKDGTGTWTINNTNNKHNGSVTVNAGTLQLGAAGVINDNNAIIIASGATLDMNGFSETVGSIAGAGIIDNHGSSESTLICGENHLSTSFSGSILNTNSIIALVKKGNGTLSLNTGTFTMKYLDLQQGAIDIASGTFVFTSVKEHEQAVLVVGNSTLHISGGTLTSAQRLVAGFGLSNGSIHISGGTLNFQRLCVGWNAIGTVTVSGGTSTFSDAVVHQDAGNGLITLTGGNIITPTIQNDSGGAGDDNLTINVNVGGTLTTSTISARATNTGIGTHSTVLNLAGGTIIASATSTFFATPSGAASTNNLYVYDNSDAIPTTINTNGYTSTAQVAILAGTGGGGIAKSGTGTLKYVAKNTYTGPTIITEGTLRLGAAEVISNVSAVIISGAGTLDMNGFTETVGSIAGSGIIDNVNGAGTPTLLCGGNNNSTTFSGVLKNSTGSLALTKNGSGTLILSGDNLYTGITTINAGTIRLGSTTALGSIAAGTTIKLGAALDLHGITYTNNEALDISGTGVSNSGVIFNSNVAPALFAGTINLNAASTIKADNQMSLTGTISNNQHFTKTGTSSLLFANNTITVNNFTISDGTIAGATSTINMYGDFINHGIFIPNTNGVIMLGSGSQTIQSADFNNVVINNVSGVVLDGNITVSGTLTLTSGILTTYSHYIDLGESGNIVETTPSLTAPTSYVLGTVKATRPLMQNVANSFGGIGIEIIENNTDNNLTEVIRVTGTYCTGIEENHSILRYFTINPTIDENLNASLAFTYFDSEIAGHIKENLRIYKSTDSRLTWSSCETLHDEDSNTLTATGITSFSDWTASDGLSSPLPIELVSFNAVNAEQGIMLSWTTATETNNDYFTVEYSINGIDWNILEYIQGAGNSSTMNHYQIFDYSVHAPIVYYRLQQTDYNGDFSYSSIVIVHDDFEQKPIHIENKKGEIIIHVPDAYQNPMQHISIISSNGKLVYTTNKHTLNINTTHFASGRYTIQIHVKEQRFTENIIIH